MRVVWKHELLANQRTLLQLHEDAVVRGVAPLGNKLYLWEEHTVPTYRQPLVERIFVVVGTGREFEELYEHFTYITTFVALNGYDVWHVYEVEQEPIRGGRPRKERVT